MCNCKCPFTHPKLKKRDKTWNVTQALRNHVTYPTLRMMPHLIEQQPKRSVYFDKYGGIGTHWASFFQISKKLDIFSDNVWLAHNSYGEEFCLNVHGKAKTLNIKPNKTLAVLYCVQLNTG